MIATRRPARPAPGDDERAAFVLGSDRTWLDRALCATHREPLWDARANTAKADRARAICAACPVAAECLDDVLRTDETVAGEKPPTIRAGLSGVERRALVAARRAARRRPPLSPTVPSPPGADGSRDV